jgi:glycosyltransferase involved in cell wall biosynthesis
MSKHALSKIPLLIASSLKPVRDIRAFEKLALSLGETNKYSLNIIGFSPKKPESTPEIRFFSSMSHSHSKLDRILSIGRFIFRLLQIQPKILICCTYEYLPPASLLKPLMGYKLIYDVQENYLANLELNPELNPSLKAKAEKVIRKAESVKGIDLFFLAEKCYATEMPDKRPFLILENKFEDEIRKKAPLHYLGKKAFKFCITGTITPAFGIWEAIEWFREILRKYPESRLEITGHCPLPSIWVKLTQIAHEVPQLSLRIEQQPVAHKVLLDCLERSDFALLPYQLHPAIAQKMPTKLFECAALNIPVLITPNPVWVEFLKEFHGGFPVDFLEKDSALIHFEQALKETFFISTPPKSILWKTEEAHLQQAIEKLFA